VTWRLIVIAVAVGKIYNLSIYLSHQRVNKVYFTYSFMGVRACLDLKIISGLPVVDKTCLCIFGFMWKHALLRHPILGYVFTSF
jgi:hypothetical protein